MADYLEYSTNRKLNNFRPRHFYGDWNGEKFGKYQVDSSLTDVARRQNGNPQIPDSILKLAYEEYHRQHRNGQSFERIQERGGFSLLEIVSLLADKIERMDWDNCGCL